ncbi:hypothetical protein HHI36_009635 [Cryptolaemus montrouzieri]|uniref:Male-enhanced antigen 1 n=1 Tax=Cryptolaemus montrouzieri TaxID=559131 RepID=A0ABD2MGB7_9CUCU
MPVEQFITLQSMVYTNPVDPTEPDNQTEDEIIAAILGDNLDVPEEVYIQHGYELLPQEPELPEYFSQNNEVIRRMNEEDENFFCPVRSKPSDLSIFDDAPPCGNPSPQMMPAPDDIVREVWSDSNSSDIEMDSEKVKEVKQVMVNITLPASAIPEWAANVPEEQWKEYLFNKLHIRQKNK